VGDRRAALDRLEGKKRVRVRAYGYKSKERASKAKLVTGRVSSNPGEVQCDWRIGCRRPFTPQPLVTHHADPSLMLYYCKGCPDLLIKVRKPKSPRKSGEKV
jgi:hypothetical protein